MLAPAATWFCPPPVSGWFGRKVGILGPGLTS